ncbi:MAG: class I SAM-dependent methyltransferase [Balneolaceae bacterium]
MSLEIRSPEFERAHIKLPDEISNLQKPFNGTVCSAEGDEYTIKDNIVDLIQTAEHYSLAQSTNHWKLTASMYENIWRKRSLSILTGEEFPIEKEHELLIQWLQPVKDGMYLDVGCSTALYARAIKKAMPSATVAALDFSIEMLQEARLKAEADLTDIYFLRADGRNLPFFSKYFDGLAMGGTLNELTDELKVLFECRRVIKDDGIFFVMHLLKSPTWYGRLLQESAEWSGLKFWSIEESNALFERAGFKTDEQFNKGIVCFTKLIAI